MAKKVFTNLLSFFPSLSCFVRRWFWMKCSRIYCWNEMSFVCSMRIKRINKFWRQHVDLLDLKISKWRSFFIISIHERAQSPELVYLWRNSSFGKEINNYEQSSEFSSLSQKVKQTLDFLLFVFFRLIFCFKPHFVVGVSFQAKRFEKNEPSKIKEI